MKYHIITLGCPKNVVDSENMAALLDRAGFICTDIPENTDVLIINTCCFILPAREEAINTILEAAALKEETGCFLIVTGCFPQRNKDELADEIPEVDSWMGLEDLSEIVEIAKNTVKNKKIRHYYNNAPVKFQNLPRKLSTPENYEYIKIAEGCLHNCSFCVIPGIRGKYRSLPMENILENAQEIVKSGRKEIILIAQDTTLYGIDLYSKKMLPDLLKRLCQLEGLNWLRLMYAYPSSLDDEMLKTIAQEDKICQYIDIPLQHSHPQVLKNMDRPFDDKETVGLIHRIRNIIPDAAIRTSFIVGHPGETPPRFQHLLDFVEKMKFYNVGVFVFSPEDGTKSAAYKTRPSIKEAQGRMDELMLVQREISHDLRRQMVGKTITAVSEEIHQDSATGGDVLIDVTGGEVGISTIPPGTSAIGRTVFDAPDIDGALFIKGNAPEPGTFFDARITGAAEYDLICDM
ncbi:MAG: 30S ribosomal protein S12 methylthiotransferase RimO [Candidatus Eremiobacteraeota bacterium]|nr:30S ribosomal protein S12 methylthiotransferase RimO [Candidatus Eremiobacteraeota bacterium]